MIKSLGNQASKLLRGLGNELKEEARALRDDARRALANDVAGGPARRPAHTPAQAPSLRNSLRASADALRSKMEPRTPAGGVPVQVSQQVLAGVLERGSGRLGNYSNAQRAKLDQLAERQQEPMGVRAQFKTSLKQAVALQAQRIADPAAIKLAKGAAYVRKDLQADLAARLARHTATVRSADELASFEAGLLQLHPDLRARPLFALGLNSWAYPPALRRQAWRAFQDLHAGAADNGGRLSALARHLDPEQADEEHVAAQAWLLASPAERDVLAHAFQWQEKMGRDQVEVRVMQSGVADAQIDTNDDLEALAQGLGIQTEAGFQALLERTMRI